MRISKLYATQRPVFSFEFFPPRTDAGYRALYRVIGELKELAPGFVSVTSHARGENRSKTAELVIRIQNELGITVLMDNANILPGDTEKLFNLVVRVPKTKFILAHIGGLNFRFWNILALARTADGFGFENLYFDISATVLVVADSPVEEEFIWTLRNVGLDHVLLGSDYPQIGLGATVEAFERLDLTTDEKAKIRSGNAMKLFGR